MSICCICKNDTILSREHLIPNALLRNADNSVVLSDVICKKCNNDMGRRTDSGFINSDLVKYLRIVNADLLGTKKNQQIIKKGELKIKDQEGNIYPYDGVFSNDGYKFIPTMKPVISDDDNKIIFIRDKPGIPELVQKYKQKGYLIDIQRFTPKLRKGGNVEFSFKLPPPQLLLKQYVITISHLFGHDIMEQYDFLKASRLYLLSPDKNPEPNYYLKLTIGKNANLPQLTRNYHSVGFGNENSLKFWYMTLFGEYNFFLAIPEGLPSANYSKIIRIS